MTTATAETRLDVARQRAEDWRRFNALPVDQRFLVPLEQMPRCYTCGGDPIGRYPDGGPRFGDDHHHSPKGVPA